MPWHTAVPKMWPAFLECTTSRATGSIRRPLLLTALPPLLRVTIVTQTQPQGPRWGQYTEMDMNIALLPPVSCPGVPSQPWVLPLYPHGALQRKDLSYSFALLLTKQCWSCQNLPQHSLGGDEVNPKRCREQVRGWKGAVTWHRSTPHLATYQHGAPRTASKGDTVQTQAPLRERQAAGTLLHTAFSSQNPVKHRK